jgi:hypothetical protein
MLKILASIALFVFAGLAGLISLISDGGVDHTIENSKAILSQFQRGAVQGNELTENGAYQVFVTPIADAQCDDTKFQNARKLAGDRVLLTVWRGEWMECYSPVSKTSTLISDRDGYSFLGSLLADKIVFGILSVMSIFAALHLFARRSEPWFKRRSKPPPAP